MSHQTHAMTLSTKPNNAFISYKWEDDAHNQWVEKFATDLRRAGIEAVLDRWEVKFGDSFTDYMTSKIAEADVVLFVMTTKAVEAAESPKGEGGAVKFEMQMATARRIAGERMRLIPVYREGQKTAAHVRDHRYADFRDDSQYQQRLLELIEDLRGYVRMPPVSVSGHLVESASVGQDMLDNRLRAEFVPGSHDLIVWAEVNDHASSDLCRYVANGSQYHKEVVQPEVSATRVKVAANGDIVVVHEREGVIVIDAGTKNVKRKIRISTPEDPMICSEVLHPTMPVAIFGNHYGKIVVWNWDQNRIVFEKQYFPREHVQYMSSLAVDACADCILFVVENTLYRVRLADGSIVQQDALGEEEETSGLAYCGTKGLLAVGGLMETKVYHTGISHRLAYSVPNGRPLVQSVRFSNDGDLLAILSGMSMGGNAVTIRDADSGATIRVFSELYPSPTDSIKNLMLLSIRSVSFSSDGKLIALGEGGRIGVYRRE